MGGGKLAGTASVALVAASLAGCGGDDNASKGTTEMSNRALKGPIHPRCGTAGFAKPRIRRLESSPKQGPTWSLNYTRSTSARRGQTNTVVLVEVNPSVPRAKDRNPKVRNITVAGRRVAFREPDSSVSVYSAQWRTRRAHYSLIATGRESRTIKRFIACLP